MALASEKAQFSALKVGYDNNADDDIDDGGDYLVVSDPFGSTEITPLHDYNGNLTYDGSFRYTYDAWNRLVKATLNDADVAIQVAVFDGLGRRIQKTVTNSGDLDGVTVYLYNGHQIVETRDGSDQVTLQVYHGTRYIDEVVGLRVMDMGRVYVHQDANWNVTALTDLTGRVVERYWYSPYGELEAHVVVHPFDYDDDGDVDDDDYDATTSTCSGTATGACRRLDADADGDVDAADQTIIAAYIATLDSDTELQRIPASTHSRRGNPFGHQGLVLDAELASYQNRARQYAPKAKRFIQRDPLVLMSVGKMRIDRGHEYTYVRQSPLRWTDSRGTCCDEPLPPGPIGADGWVCCDDDGVAQPCAKNEINNPCMQSCVIAHEQSHADDCNGEALCEGRECTGGAPCVPARGGNDNGECEAFTAQFNCLAQCAQPGTEEACELAYTDCMSQTDGMCDPNFPPDPWGLNYGFVAASCKGEVQQISGCEGYGTGTR